MADETVLSELRHSSRIHRGFLRVGTELHFPRGCAYCEHLSVGGACPGHHRRWRRTAGTRCPSTSSSWTASATIRQVDRHAEFQEHLRRVIKSATSRPPAAPPAAP
jgi:hypothetical protein